MVLYFFSPDVLATTRKQNTALDSAYGQWTHLFIYLYVYLFPFMSLFSKVNSLTAKKQLTAFLIPKGMLVLSFHLFI